MDKLILEGKGNYGLKQDYADKIAVMSDEELFKEAEKMIWLSAYASNNPRSDYHWQCDATWDEGNRRNKPDIYKKAHAAVMKSAGH